MRPLAALALAVAVPTLAPAVTAAEAPTPRPRPWAELGLSDRQAAMVLLNRFTFGPRPGEVDEVVATGVWEWFDAQLNPGPDPVLDRLLAEIPVHGLDGYEVAHTYRSLAELELEAVRSGLLSTDGDVEPETAQAMVLREAAARGLRSRSDLLDDLARHTFVRMVHGRSQLREVLTVFWLDHLCVSVADPDVTPWMLDYQMTALRPRALESFRELLEASARHPAMLFFLDLHDSSASPGAATTADLRTGPERVAGTGRATSNLSDRSPSGASGPNENYARELLELHTLGVTGGYTEKDVAEVARALTGWTVGGSRASEYRPDGGSSEGFVFRPERHDADAKRVLGHALAPGRGIEDGLEVLDLVARHPSTARHVCRRLAEAFVSDHPPDVLVDDLAAAWRASDGHIPAVLTALVAHPAFWTEAARESKIKSPLELVASALRSVGARVGEGSGLRLWLRRLGQPLHAPPTPAGWGHASADWLDAGSVLARQRFAFALASEKVAGIVFEWPLPPSDHEPLDRRLRFWADRLLPERPHRPLLEPVLSRRGDLEASPLFLDQRDRFLVGFLLASPEYQRR